MSRADDAKALAPIAPPCFDARLQWLEYVGTAAEAHRPGHIPGPLVFEGRKPVRFNPKFSFCEGCDDADHIERKKRAGLCQPDYLINLLERAKKPRLKTLNLHVVRIDGGTQSRVALNEQAVEDYANVLREGGELPPITVFFDGSDYWLADGFHRFHAFRKIERASVQAEVREGTRRDAMLFSFGANDAHGLRRSNEDKRKVVLEMLTDAEWSHWTDAAIAKACRVDHKTVGKHRASLGNSQVSDEPAARTYTTKHGTQATMNTAAIGKARASVPAPAEAAAPVEIAGNPAISGSPAVPRPDADEKGVHSIDTPGGAQDVRAVTATAPAAAQPTQVIEPYAMPAGPEADDDIDLGEQLAQMADDLERQLAENAVMAAVIEADDKLAAVFKENAKLRERVRILEELLRGAESTRNEAISAVKARDREIAKLKKQLKAAGEPA